MAIWQFGFIVVPKACMDKENPKVCSSSYWDEDGFFDDEACWLANPTEISSFEVLEKILPLGKSWSEEILLFGTEDSNRVEVYHEPNGLVKGFSFRLDLRIDYSGLLSQMVQFIQLQGLTIFDDQMLHLESNYTSIKKHLDNSEGLQTFQKFWANDKT